jgi:hypothetical protein
MSVISQDSIKRQRWFGQCGKDGMTKIKKTCV